MPSSKKYPKATEHRLLQLYKDESLDYYLLEGDKAVISQKSLLRFLGISFEGTGKVFFPEQKDITPFYSDADTVDLGIPVTLVPLICIGFAEFGIADPAYKDQSENAFRLLTGLSLIGLNTLIEESDPVRKEV